MTDRDGLQAFEAWLKVYFFGDKPQPTDFLDVDDLREAWVQGVAWGRQHPEEFDRMRQAFIEILGLAKSSNTKAIMDQRSALIRVIADNCLEEK